MRLFFYWNRGRIGRKVWIVTAILQVIGHGAVAFRVGPETIPGPLPMIEVDGDVAIRRNTAEAGADVDMRLRAEVDELLLDAWVLSRRLDVAGDGVEDGRILRVHGHVWARSM